MDEPPQLMEVQLEEMANDLDIKVEVVRDLLLELVQEAQIHGLIAPDGHIFLKLPPAVASEANGGYSKGIIVGPRLKSLLEPRDIADLFSFFQDHFQHVAQIGPFLLFEAQIAKRPAFQRLQAAIDGCKDQMPFDELTADLGLTREEATDLAKLLSEASDRNIMVGESGLSFRIREVCYLCNETRQKEAGVWHRCTKCHASFCPRCYQERILPGVLVDFGECPKCQSPDDSLEELGPLVSSEMSFTGSS